MSNILNLLNQRTIALASLGACATIAAYCIYSRKSWSISRIQEAQQAADQATKNVGAAVSANTSASSDSGLTASDGPDELPHQQVQIRRGRGDSGIVDNIVAMEKTDDADAAASELDLVASAMCQNFASPVPLVAKDAKLHLSKPVAKDANNSSAPLLTAQFIDARLRVLSNAPDNAALLLADGDADILIKRLYSLLSNGEQGGTDAGQLIGHLQLIGRLLLSPQRAEPLCRNGRLYEALADLYERQAEAGVEIRVRCVLALASARGANNNSVSMATTDLRLAPLLVDDAVASDRVRPHALRLLNQLGPACHPLLTGRLSALLARLRRLGSSDSTASSADDVGFCLIAELLAKLINDPKCRSVAYSPSTLVASIGEFSTPSTRRLRRDVAMRMAWLELLGALACEASRAELASIWWPTLSSGGGCDSKAGKTAARGGDFVALAGRPAPLAAAVRAQMSEIYKQVKKMANGMKSSEKKSQPGQRLLAVKKELKLLKQLAKHKPKPAKKK
ncbi:hypothetical protein BOX15_Mlig016316g1 [Macrostomum lignano]|uniref:Uncharacterized protein n=2 Tax=Macrostomum lignano TaxID=282301 RepID=A0A267GRS5_9PLAT|nr:hypothetical protein BOX15_Mlig016316g1 [Macrostomum lignano]